MTVQSGTSKVPVPLDGDAIRASLRHFKGPELGLSIMDLEGVGLHGLLSPRGEMSRGPMTQERT